jgi:hypothetical protein
MTNVGWLAAGVLLIERWSCIGRFYTGTWAYRLRIFQLIGSKPERQKKSFKHCYPIGKPENIDQIKATNVIKPSMCRMNNKK